MANKTKIKLDKYGLFVRAGGYFFSPVWSCSSFAIGYQRESGKTDFVEGEIVKAAHMGGTTFGRVRSLDGETVEVWDSRGSAYDCDTGKNMSAEAAYEKRQAEYAKQKAWRDARNKV